MKHRLMNDMFLFVDICVCSMNSTRDIQCYDSRSIDLMFKEL